MQEKANVSEKMFSEKSLPSINQRVRDLIKYYSGDSVKRFSEMIGIASSQKLNRIFNIDKRNGEYPEVSSEVLISIANRFTEINLRWLITGSENMFSRETKNASQHGDTMNDKLFDIIKLKDAKIEEQCKQIGRLEKEIQFSQEKDTLIKTQARQIERLETEISYLKNAVAPMAAADVTSAAVTNHPDHLKQ